MAIIESNNTDVDQNLQHLIYNNGQRTLIGGRHKRACWGTNTRHGENTEAHYPPVRLLGGGEPYFRRVIDLLPSLSSLSPTRLSIVSFPPLRSARCHGRVRIPLPPPPPDARSIIARLVVRVLGSAGVEEKPLRSARHHGRVRIPLPPLSGVSFTPLRSARRHGSAPRRAWLEGCR
jgi:hypothetical protein